MLIQSTPLAEPLVIDAPRKLLAVPVDNVLLADLDWESLVKYFNKDRVHASAAGDEAPVLAISNTHRLVGLLPVSAKTGSQTTRFLAPFLIGTGSPYTHFTKATADKFKLATVDHITVLGCPILFWPSSSHFDDINLLGTDVLKACKLVIDYPTGVASLEVRPRNPSNKIDVTTAGLPMD